MSNKLDINLNFLSDADIEKFEEIGLLGPFQLIDSQKIDSTFKQLKKARFKHYLANRILSRLPAIKHFFREARWGKAKWKKGFYLISQTSYDLATSPTVLDKVESIIGSNVILWSSLFTIQQPGKHLHWHADGEFLEWEGITVWLCLKAVDRQTPMRVISRSHRLPTHPSELRHKSGLDPSNDEAVLQAAQQLDEKCDRILMDAKPGEFLIFSGRLWHSIKNESSLLRSAIIFQYSSTSDKIKKPLKDYNFPITWDLRPVPCCLVRGKDEYNYNLIVKPDFKL